MPTTKSPYRTKATLLLRETWRRAWRAGQLEITFRTESQAHKARMDLYKAVQPEKQDKSEDLELRDAAQSLEIVLGPTRNMLIMRPRGQNDIFAALQEATGLTLEEMVDPDLQRQMKESLEKVAGRVPLPAVKPETPPEPAGASDDLLGQFGVRNR